MGADLIYNRVMNKIFRPFCLAATLLLAVGLGNAQEKIVKQVPAKPTVAIDGKSLFAQYCTVCHGTDAKGGGPAASALKQAPGDLTQISHNNAGRFPEQRVLRMLKGEESVVSHGTQEMPIWGPVFGKSASLGMEQTRVYAILQYVEDLQAK
jgi:mono/diheme cytochrome c family protein